MVKKFDYCFSKNLHPAIDSWVWNEVQAELERRLKIDLSTKIIDFLKSS